MGEKKKKSGVRDRRKEEWPDRPEKYRRKEPRQKMVWMKIREIEESWEDAACISCRSQITWRLRWI